MSQARFPQFRRGAMPATAFTGTRTERCGEPVERLPTPERLADWFVTNGLEVGACTPGDLAAARELREAIHAAATAAAQGEALPESAVRVVNDHNARGRPVAVLSPDGSRRWRLRSDAQVADALAVVAADAITLLSGGRDGAWSLCASPTCRAAFFDTSQGRTRRWCDMNTCGNRQKKARLQAR